MQSRSEAGQSRREMFRSSARYMALGGLALLSAGLLARPRGSPARSRCRRAVACRRCAALANCRLPQALLAKKASKR